MRVARVKGQGLALAPSRAVATSRARPGTDERQEHRMRGTCKRVPRCTAPDHDHTRASDALSTHMRRASCSPAGLRAHRGGAPRRPRAGFRPLAAAFGGGNRRRTESTGVLGRSPAGMLAAPWPLALAGAAGAAAGRRHRGTRVLCSMHVGAAGGLRPSAEIHRGALGRDGGPPDLKARPHTSTPTFV